MNESHRICINAPRRSLPKRAARYAKRALAVGINKLGPDGCNEWTTKDHRRYLLFAASGGLSIKKLLEIAIRTLDEANLRILIKRLARGTNRQTKAVPDTDIDLIICYFWDDVATHDGAWAQLPGLSRWGPRAASAFVSFHLHQQGVRYSLSPEAYRKRIKRLRKRGAKLAVEKPLLVVRAEFESPNTLVVTKESDKT